MNKKTLLIAGAGLVMTLAVAAAVYLGLRLMLPRKVQSAANSAVVPQSKEQLAKQADALFQSGDDALKNGDAEKGIADLQKAQKFYEQVGDTTKIDQIKDQISLAEYDMKVKAENQPSEQPQDQGKTSKKS